MIKCAVCDKPAKYHYHNKLSGFSGDYCEEHLRTLRRDVSIEYWLEVHYAEIIESEELKGGKV